jgi:hypothetical protein
MLLKHNYPSLFGSIKQMWYAYESYDMIII